VQTRPWSPRRCRPSPNRETATVFERIDASISPVSPTIRVFLARDLAAERPSMRTVSLNTSLPSNSDPWSMNADRPPEEVPEDGAE
jgi:hypothetical protein